MSEIVKEYSSTPTEPIRIQRRLGQFSPAFLSSLIPLFSFFLSWSTMEEKAGDGRPVKPHSVRQPTPWDPSSPSLVDGSLYTGSRLFMNHHDMCSRRAPILFRLRAPCNLAEVRTSPNVCFSSRHLSSRTSSRRINILYLVWVHRLSVQSYGNNIDACRLFARQTLHIVITEIHLGFSVLLFIHEFIDQDGLWSISIIFL